MYTWLMNGSLDENLVDIARTLGYFGTYLFAWYYYAAARKRNIFFSKLRIIIFTSHKVKLWGTARGAGRDGST